jgi:hypothetical protein
MIRLILVLVSLLVVVPCAAEDSDWGTADGDGDGYTRDEGDCNDGDPDINPGVREICDDEIDNDCDLALDFDDPECTACGACSTTAGPADGAVVWLVVALWLVWRRGRLTPR